jgi:hypothetical protein
MRDFDRGIITGTDPAPGYAGKAENIFNSM